MNSIYVPSDDSYFLSDILNKQFSKYSNINQLKILDMGSGSGIQTETLMSLGILQENFTLVDINPKSISYLLNKFPKFRIIKSDLFKKINEKFDVIIFNPPYLPEDKKEPKNSRLATTGGKKGSEIINRFLKQAKEHLNKNGKIILLTSSFTKKINFYNYKKKLLGEKKLFFEELYVWELRL